MENKFKICSECNTENEEKYEYCKNCGSPLKSQEENAGFHSSAAFEGDDGYFNPSKNYQSAQNGTPPFTQNTAPVYSNIFTETIDGLPYGDYAVFVGKKGDKYMPVFSKSEIMASKVSWHWPTALLGFFLGPIGAAIWFFYRKLYKPALLLCVIGAALLILNSVFVAPDLLNTAGADFSELYASILSGEFLENIDSLALAFNFIIRASEIAIAVLCGLFTHHIYKKHIRKVIIKYRKSEPDPRYYQMALCSLGGTSGGMLALGILMLIFLPRIISFVTNLL